MSSCFIKIKVLSLCRQTVVSYHAKVIVDYRRKTYETVIKIIKLTTACRPLRSVRATRMIVMMTGDVFTQIHLSHRSLFTIIQGKWNL